MGIRSEGKGRPVKVVLANIQTKREILRNAKKLRQSESEILQKVFINPDLTTAQKATDKKLREEMWKRRGDGENVIIHRGEIVTATHTVRKTRTKVAVDDTGSKTM